MPTSSPPSSPTISLCMIVKNEEKFLEQCLASVQSLVDEIIIVDTGSTDRTKDIALSFGAKIYDLKWADDFSAARNESLKYATGDWILVLDADEVIAKEDHAKIRELVHSKDGVIRDVARDSVVKGGVIKDSVIRDSVVGYILIQRNYFRSLEDLAYGSFHGMRAQGTGGEKGFVPCHDDLYKESRNMVGWLPTPIVRLFRKTQDMAFFGRVHEDVAPSLQGKIISVDVPIHHFGKLDPESWKKKWELYERLGEQKAKEENDYYAYFELGRQYLARKKLKESKEMFEKSISLNDKYWLPWFNLGSVHLLEQAFDKAVACLQRAILLNPNVPQVYANLGVAYVKKKEFQKAIDTFTLGLNLNPRRADIFKNMGLCYTEMGDKKRASLAFKKAVELNPAYKKIINP